MKSGAVVPASAPSCQKSAAPSVLTRLVYRLQRRQEYATETGGLPPTAGAAGAVSATPRCGGGRVTARAVPAASSPAAARNTMTVASRAATQMPRRWTRRDGMEHLF